jgi:RecA-family ATPase
MLFHNGNPDAEIKKALDSHIRAIDGSFDNGGRSHWVKVLALQITEFSGTLCKLSIDTSEAADRLRNEMCNSRVSSRLNDIQINDLINEAVAHNEHKYRGTDAFEENLFGQPQAANGAHHKSRKHDVDAQYGPDPGDPRFSGEYDPPPEPKKPLEPLPFISAADWESDPHEPQEFLSSNPQMIPRGEVSVFNGEGSMNKTYWCLQFGAAKSAGLECFGMDLSPPEPVLFFSAEDDEKVMKFRVNNIIQQRSDMSWDQLKDFRFYCPVDENAALVVYNRKSGKVEETDMFRKLDATLDVLRPALLFIENASDVFVGPEIDREFVTQCMSALKRLARKYNVAIVLLQHISVSGKASGSMTSGSTSFHNKSRFRFSIEAEFVDKPAKANGNMADPGPTMSVAEKDLYRILKCQRNSRGRKFEDMRFRNKEGYLVLDTSGETDQVSRDAADDTVFLGILDRLLGTGSYVGPNATSARNYAPTVFAKQPECARYGKQAKYRMERALFRLRSKETITIISKPGEKPSKAPDVLVRNSSIRPE